jgi:hypothetical protein
MEFVSVLMRRLCISRIRISYMGMGAKILQGWIPMKLFWLLANQVIDLQLSTLSMSLLTLAPRSLRIGECLHMRMMAGQMASNAMSMGTYIRVAEMA